MRHGKRHHAVAAYLEDLDVRAFKKHRASLKEVLGRRHGIYALYRRGRIYYVGLATNLFARIEHHTRDRHGRRWDRFSAYVTHRVDQVRELECLSLRILAPEGNRVRGRFKGSEDLKKCLGKVIKDRYRRDIGEILGGEWSNRAKRRAVRDTRGAALLATISGRRRRLVGRYKGKEYAGILLKNGKIRVRGRKFDSPHTAAAAALGFRRNGWYFWRYDAGRGNWAKLIELRAA